MSPGSYSSCSCRVLFFVGQRVPHPMLLHDASPSPPASPLSPAIPVTPIHSETLGHHVMHIYITYLPPLVCDVVQCPRTEMPLGWPSIISCIFFFMSLGHTGCVSQQNANTSHAHQHRLSTTYASGRSTTITLTRVDTELSCASFIWTPSQSERHA